MNHPIDSKQTAKISDELRALTRRADHLERSNRMLKIVSLVALAAVIATSRIPITSAGQSGIINALQFNLFSRSGPLLATLGANTSGFPSLAFFDAAGKRLTQVGEADNGKGAGIFGFDGNALLPGKGVQRAGFGVSTVAAGGGESDGSGIARIETGITSDSSSSGLTLYDAKSVLRAALAQDTSAFPFIFFLTDANGKTRAFIDESTSGDPLLGLTDASGKNGAFGSERPETGVNQGASFAVTDSKGNLRVATAESEHFKTAAVEVFDANFSAGKTLSPRGGVFETFDDSDTYLAINDRSGANRVVAGFIALSTPPDSSFVDLFDSTGKSKVFLVADNTSTGFAGLDLLDTNGTGRAGLLEPLNGGNAAMFFNDSTNKSIGGWNPPAAPNP